MQYNRELFLLVCHVFNFLIHHQTIKIEVRFLQCNILGPSVADRNISLSQCGLLVPDYIITAL